MTEKTRDQTYLPSCLLHCTHPWIWLTVICGKKNSGIEYDFYLLHAVWKFPGGVKNLTREKSTGHLFYLCSHESIIVLSELNNLAKKDMSYANFSRSSLPTGHAKTIYWSGIFLVMNAGRGIRIHFIFMCQKKFLFRLFVWGGGWFI